MPRSKKPTRKDAVLLGLRIFNLCVFMGWWAAGIAATLMAILIGYFSISFVFEWRSYWKRRDEWIAWRKKSGAR